MLVAAGVRRPALCVARQPASVALGALRDQCDALGAHRSSLTHRAGPATPNSARLGSSPRAPTRVVAFGLPAGAVLPKVDWGDSKKASAGESPNSRERAPHSIGAVVG
jgi:hypothetical protein